MGRYAEARDLDQDTLDRSRRVLGDDHPDTLISANSLAIDLYAAGGGAGRPRPGPRHPRPLAAGSWARTTPTPWAPPIISPTTCAQLGEVQAARDLDQDTLDRMRRILGEDHPSTLNSANNLAADLRALGEVQAARDLDQDTLNRRCRILGEDHPDTLYRRRGPRRGPTRTGRGPGRPRPGPRHPRPPRRVLGEDHPSTLASANNLAADLRALGEVQAARDLDQDTLGRRRRVLGEDHPDTLTSANNLAEDLRALEESGDS